jgi:hypothetical protein
MQPLGLGRVALALASFGLVVAGVVVATEGSTFPGTPPPSVALAPAAVVTCPAVGAYRPPERGGVGLPTGLALCASGPIVVRSPGALIDGWDVTGGILVDAEDVVVRRSRVTGDGTSPYGIRTTPAGSVRIEDTTISGDFPKAGIGGDRWTAERVEITRVTHDGAHLGSRATLRNSWLHEFTPPSGIEATALELVGPEGHALIEGNRVEMGTGPGHRAAVLLNEGRSAAGEAPAVVIRDNVLGGGEYTLHQDGGAGEPVRIIGNRFGRDSGQGPLRVPAATVLDGNTFVDGGLVTRR